MLDDKNNNGVALLIADNKTDAVICENCHAKVSGSYCSQCGQSIESTIKYFWSVLLHLLDDIFSFDSRASRTLKPLLLKPGFLTQEYIQGRRVHYVPPLRLYLFISIIFFISLNFFAVDGKDQLVHEQRMAAPLEQVTQYIGQLEHSLNDLSLIKKKLQLEKIKQYKQYQADLSLSSASKASELTKEIVEYEFSIINNEEPISDKSQQKLRDLKEKLAQIKIDKTASNEVRNFSIANNDDGSLTFDFLSDENNKRLNTKIATLEKKGLQALNSDARPLIKQSISKLPQLMFILLPLFALILKIFYLFANRLYLEHLTVALHSHSFIFLIIFLVNILEYGQEHLITLMPNVANGLGYLAMLLLVWLPCYLLLMQKRVYQQGYLLTLVKFSVIGIIYFNLIILTAIVAFFWGLTDI
tara:strand:+ start:27678 stop:28919 length:1242 start_codon:yes stop_codon:yes gene_type:complete